MKKVINLVEDYFDMSMPIYRDGHELNKRFNLSICMRYSTLLRYSYQAHSESFWAAHWKVITNEKNNNRLF